VADIESEDGAIVSIVLEQFPDYYGAPSYLDRIQFRFYPSCRAALEAYEEGEVEGVSQVRGDDLARARESVGLNLFSAQTAENAMVLLNTDRNDALFFQESGVRQALMYALDREAIIDQVLGGQALLSNSPILPGNWAYSPDASVTRYDPDQAIALLDETGWERPARLSGVRHKGLDDFAFTLLTSNDPRREAVAEMLAEQWAEMGIEVTVDSVSDAELIEALEDRDFQAALVHLQLAGDPDPYPFWHETQVGEGQNYAGFVHRRMSEVAERARVTVSRARREELYREFQVLFAEQLPALPLYVPVYTYGVDEGINDVQIGPLMDPSDRFRTILDWWIVHRRVFVSAGEAGP
jgi:peptide/nickel transport system substrate-binding protein